MMRTGISFALIMLGAAAVESPVGAVLILGGCLIGVLR